MEKSIAFYGAYKYQRVFMFSFQYNLPFAYITGVLAYYILSLVLVVRRWVVWHSYQLRHIAARDLFAFDLHCPGTHKSEFMRIGYVATNTLHKYVRT